MVAVEEISSCFNDGVPENGAHEPEEPDDVQNTAEDCIQKNVENLKAWMKAPGTMEEGKYD